MTNKLTHEEQTQAELNTLAAISGNISKTGSVKLICHGYDKLAEITENSQGHNLLAAKAVRTGYLVPARDLINAEVANKLGMTKEAYLDAVRGGNDSIITKADGILSSKEFEEYMKPKLTEAISGINTVLNDAKFRGYFKTADGSKVKEYESIFAAHESMPGGECPKGCPIKGAREIFGSNVKSSDISR